MVSPASVTGTAGLGDDVERAALAGVLAGRDTDQLVEEVITAWDELKQARESLAHLNQRNRVLELDLAVEDYPVVEFVTEVENEAVEVGDVVLGAVAVVREVELTVAAYREAAFFGVDLGCGRP